MRISGCPSISLAQMIKVGAYNMILKSHQSPSISTVFCFLPPACLCNKTSSHNQALGPAVSTDSLSYLLQYQITLCKHLEPCLINLFHFQYFFIAQTLSVFFFKGHCKVLRQEFFRAILRSFPC